MVEKEKWGRPLLGCILALILMVVPFSFISGFILGSQIINAAMQVDVVNEFVTENPRAVCTLRLIKADEVERLINLASMFIFTSIRDIYEVKWDYPESWIEAPMLVAYLDAKTLQPIFVSTAFWKSVDQIKCLNGLISYGQAYDEAISLWKSKNPGDFVWGRTPFLNLAFMNNETRGYYFRIHSRNNRYMDNQHIEEGYVVINLKNGEVMGYDNLLGIRIVNASCRTEWKTYTTSAATYQLKTALVSIVVENYGKYPLTMYEFCLTFYDSGGSEEFIMNFNNPVVTATNPVPAGMVSIVKCAWKYPYRYQDSHAGIKTKISIWELPPSLLIITLVLN